MLAHNTTTANCVHQGAILNALSWTLSPLFIPYFLLISSTNSSLVVRGPIFFTCTVALLTTAVTSVASLKATLNFSTTSLTTIFFSSSMSMCPTLVFLIPVAPSIVFLAAIILLYTSIQSRPSSTLIKIASFLPCPFVIPLQLPLSLPSLARALEDGNPSDPLPSLGTSRPEPGGSG